MTMIQLNDSIQESMFKMSEGNLGAIKCLMVLAKEAPEIDPDSVLGALGPLMMLDTFGIYGSDIYILYNDKCNHNIRKMILLIRATQCGVMKESRLKELAEDQGRQVNITKEEWENLEKWVVEELPNFKEAFNEN